MFMLTEADAMQCSQRAGCQSSPGGGGILTAGEKGKQYTAVGTTQKLRTHAAW